jgi:Ser/Thr protein kinase RdoA (MazF antagonist)
VEGGDARSACQTLAGSLAALHQGEVRPGRRVPPGEHLAGVVRAAGYVAWADPELAPALGEIVAGVACGLDGDAAAPVHRDLKPDHVLLTDDGPGLVDLDSCALADPVIDPATLLARLRGLPLEHPVPAGAAEAAARAFKDAYLAAVPASWAARLQPLYAGALVELAASLFRRQVRGWEAAVGVLVDDAVASVA